MNSKAVSEHARKAIASAGGAVLGMAVGWPMLWTLREAIIHPIPGRAGGAAGGPVSRHGPVAVAERFDAGHGLTGTPGRMRLWRITDL